MSMAQAQAKPEPTDVFENKETAVAAGYLPLNDSLKDPRAPGYSFGRRLVKRGLVPFAVDLRGFRYVKPESWEGWEDLKTVRAAGPREKLPSKVRRIKSVKAMATKLVPGGDITGEDIESAVKVLDALMTGAWEEAKAKAAAAEALAELTAESETAEE